MILCQLDLAKPKILRLLEGVADGISSDACR